MNEETINLWTTQTSIVLDTLRQQNVYYVKRKYVDQKYQETAWIFQQAYAFFVQRAEKIVERPAEAESPVWLFYDRMWTAACPGACRLHVRIPRGEVILFDTRKWSAILNLSYLGTEREQERFAEELKRRGIVYASDVFEKPYYPDLKRQIIKSWDSLFAESCEDERYIQAASWKLKKEWILKMEG